jgi:F-type H+/Na+-transporting ATPase subunit alpha
VIWAATNGYTDDIAVEDVRRFETSLLSFVDNSHPGLLAAIADKKILTDEIKNDLKQVLEDFRLEWKKDSSKPELPLAVKPSPSAAVQPA